MVVADLLLERPADVNCRDPSVFSERLERAERGGDPLAIYCAFAASGRSLLLGCDAESVVGYERRGNDLITGPFDADAPAWARWQLAHSVGFARTLRRGTTEAESIHRRALKVARSTGYRRGEAISSAALGWVALTKGDLAETFVSSYRALAFGGPFPDAASFGITNLVRVCQTIGAYGQGFALGQRLLGTRDSAPPSLYRHDHFLVAETALGAGRLDEAAALIGLANQVAWKDGEAESHLADARLFLALADRRGGPTAEEYLAAVRCLEEAREALTTPRFAVRQRITTELISVLARAGHSRRAQREAAGIDPALVEPRDRVTLRRSLATASADLGNYKAAYELLVDMDSQSGIYRPFEISLASSALRSIELAERCRIARHDLRNCIAALVLHAGVETEDGDEEGAERREQAITRLLTRISDSLDLLSTSDPALSVDAPTLGF